MAKTLSVAAIKNGTVIDHIRAGQAMRILRLLKIATNKKHRATLGSNYPSKRLGLKDLIKIENYFLTPEQASEIVILAPEATFNIIKEFEVVEKLNASLPSSICNVFACLNQACVSQVEPVPSQFYIEDQGNEVKLICHYCEKIFDRDQIRVNIP